MSNIKRQDYLKDEISKIEEEVTSINNTVNNLSIPKKTSELINDSNFLTEHQDLSNYATKKDMIGDNFEVPEGEIWVKSTNETLDGFTVNEDGYLVMVNTNANVDLNGKGITFIKFGASETIAKIQLYNNSIKKLDVSMLPNVERVFLQDNPICLDKEALENFIETLPDRNGKAIGSITVSDQDIRREVEYGAIKKEWYFGSLLQFDSTKYAKVGSWIKESGLVDVWESAEYGEGTSVVLLDCGYSSDLKSIDYDNVELYAADGTGNTFLASALSSQGNNYYHGNSALTLAIGNGAVVYGGAPKSKALAIKIVDESRGMPIVSTIKASWEKIKEYAQKNEVVAMEWSNTNSGASLNFEDLIDFFESMQNPSLYSKGTCILIDASGNYGQHYSDPLREFRLGSLNGNISLGGYNSITAADKNTTPRVDLDLGFYSYKISIEKTKGTKLAMSGTSIGAHALNGCVAIVYNMLKKKNKGVPPTNKELYNYIIKHTRKPTSSMKVSQVGNGLFSLLAYNDTAIEKPKITRNGWSDEALTLLGDDINFEMGSISKEGIVSSDTRISSTKFIDIPKGTYTITKKDTNWNLALRFFNQDETFYGSTVNGVDFTSFVKVTEFTTPKDLKFKITLGKVGDPTLNLNNNIYITDLFQITKTN